MPCMQSKGGRFEVLKWVSENARFTWTERHCAEAAASDNLPLLKWLRKKGCPWDGQVCADAGSKKLLRWALANGCPFGVQEIEGVVSAGNLGIAERMYQILVASRPNGKIEWQEDFFATIAQHGSRRQLEWLKAHGCAWCEKTGMNAVRFHNRKAMLWLIANEYPWSEQVKEALIAIRRWLV